MNIASPWEKLVKHHHGNMYILASQFDCMKKFVWRSMNMTDKLTRKATAAKW